MGESQSQTWLEGIASKGVSPGRAKGSVYGYQDTGRGSLLGRVSTAPASLCLRHQQTCTDPPPRRWVFSAADLVTEWPSHY